MYTIVLQARQLDLVLGHLGQPRLRVAAQAAQSLLLLLVEVRRQAIQSVHFGVLIQFYILFTNGLKLLKIQIPNP